MIAVLAVLYVSCRALTATVSEGIWNYSLRLHCLQGWLAVVSEQALSLQMPCSAYLCSNIELMVMNWVWLLHCGSMLNSLGA